MLIPLLLLQLLSCVLVSGYKNLRPGRSGSITRDPTITKPESIKCGSTVLIKHTASKKCFTLANASTTSSDDSGEAVSDWYVSLETCDLHNPRCHWLIHCCDQYMMRCTGDISQRNIDTSNYPKYAQYASSSTHSGHSSSSRSKSILESLYNPIHSEGSKPVKYGNPVPASDITYDTYLQIESRFGRTHARKNSLSSSNNNKKNIKKAKKQNKKLSKSKETNDNNNEVLGLGCISTDVREEGRTWELNVNLDANDDKNRYNGRVVTWQNGQDHEKLIIKQCEGSFMDISDSGYGEQMVQTDKWAFNLWDSKDVIETDHIFRLMNVKFPGCLGSNDDTKNGIRGEFVQGYSCNTGLGKNDNWNLRFIPINVTNIDLGRKAASEAKSASAAAATGKNANAKRKNEL